MKYRTVSIAVSFILLTLALLAQTGYATVPVCGTNGDASYVPVGNPTEPSSQVIVGLQGSSQSYVTQSAGALTITPSVVNYGATTSGDFVQEFYGNGEGPQDPTVQNCEDGCNLIVTITPPSDTADCIGEYQGSLGVSGAPQPPACTTGVTGSQTCELYGANGGPYISAKSSSGSINYDFGTIQPIDIPALTQAGQYDIEVYMDNPYQDQQQSSTTIQPVYYLMANSIVDVVAAGSSTLSVGASVLIPGAAPYINFTYIGVQCTPFTYIEIAPNGQCVLPSTLSTSQGAPQEVLCNVANPASSSLAMDPWPPCLMDTAQTYETSLGTSGTPYCTISSFFNAPGTSWTQTESTDTSISTPYYTRGYPAGIIYYAPASFGIQPGNYSVCSYYGPEEAVKSGVAQAGPYNPQIDSYINITSDEDSGPSFGGYLAFGQPTFSAATPYTETVAFTANTAPGTPYTNYLTSISPSVSSSSQSTIVVYELGNDSQAQGCVDPISLLGSSIGGSGNAYCASSGTVTTPCILQSSSSGFTLPTGALQPTSRYVMCAYDYLGGSVSYPHTSTVSSTSPAVSLSTTGSQPHVNQTLAYFFASANIICNNGTCTPGSSWQEQPLVTDKNAGAPLSTAVGFVNVSPAYITQSNEQANVNATAYGVGAYSLTLYLMKYAFSTFQGWQQACAAAPTTVTQTCTGDNPSDLSGAGCMISFTPSTSGGFSCSASGSVPSYASCSCQAYTPGACAPGVNSAYCTQPPSTYGDACSILTKTPVSPSGSNPTNINIAPGVYFYCLFTGGLFVQNGGGFLTVVNNTGVIPAYNPGSASLTPLQQEICTLYTYINTIFILVALTVLMIGAILYMGAHVLPSQSRGMAQSWATGMLLGGIVGVAIAGISIFALSVATATPISYILTTCVGF